MKTTHMQLKNHPVPLILGILIFLFSSQCSNNQEHTTNTESVESVPTPKDSITSPTYQTEVDETPFTANPHIIRLTDNLLYIDSLKPYFKYPDVERLDMLCKRVKKYYSDSLCTVVFSNNKIQLKDKSTPFHLGEYQFIMGNLKKMPGQPDVLIFLDYIEAWGKSLVLVSVDENHKIIDIESYCSTHGDGGDFVFVEIKHQDFFNYFFIKKHGYRALTTPIDTITYTKTVGKITLNNGRFEKSILKIDSNIVELKKANY
jgi:hypothetical protein